MSQVLIYGRQEGKSERMRIAIEALRAAGHTVVEAAPAPGLTGLRADIVAIDYASAENTVLHMLLTDGTHVWQGPQPEWPKLFEYRAVALSDDWRKTYLQDFPSPPGEGHGRACMCDRCARGKRPKNSY